LHFTEADHKNEHEVLLRHGQAFELLEHEEKNGIHYMTVATA
jgi:hypothetical protein